MKVENLVPGKTYLSVTRERMGNTTMSGDSVHGVEIVEVSDDFVSAIVRWNGNAPKVLYARDLRKLREVPPEWLKDGWRGSYCYVCRARRADGHRPDCKHPRAVRAREKLALEDAVTEGDVIAVARDGVLRWCVIDLVDGETVAVRVVDAEGGLVKAIRTTRDALETELKLGMVER